ncbi:MAG: N-(5'-phosphoribosyl)anthranilate isomerase [Rubellimicrobium sp.]|nr:N-(5'-phosphoribosyl)anthranilate isomerase [Rubellimicrobium sp.]
MSDLAPSPATFSRHAHDWLDNVFHCRATQTGGVIRRQVMDVEREVGRKMFEDEVQRRGFRLLRTRHHYLIVCDQGPIDLLF